jgi:CBS domain-containing protein
MQIKAIMTEQVSSVRPDTPVAEVARTLRDSDIGSTPVADDERLIGIVTDRDIVTRIVAAGTDPRTATARDAMSPKILYCFDDQTVEEVLANMGDQQIRRLPVVNRDKRLVGIVSLGDLAKASKRKAGDALREISQPAKH